jgi:hypothetical protein
MATAIQQQKLMMNIVLTENGPVNEDGSPLPIYAVSNASTQHPQRSQRSHSWASTTPSTPSSPISSSAGNQSRVTSRRSSVEERTVVYTENGPIEA